MATKIVLPEDNGRVSLDTLVCGDTFLFEESLWKLTDEDTLVSLSCGTQQPISYVCEPVELVDIEINVKRRV